MDDVRRSLGKEVCAKFKVGGAGEVFCRERLLNPAGYVCWVGSLSYIRYIWLYGHWRDTNRQHWEEGSWLTCICILCLRQLSPSWLLRAYRGGAYGSSNGVSPGGELLSEYATTVDTVALMSRT